VAERAIDVRDKRRGAFVEHRHGALEHLID
jgi:hypothetical protein